MSLPERLGRLRRIDRIGAGGFATVWLYHDDELDSPVAVKALADNWAQRDDVCDRFLEEARILRRADSDHVVRVYDIGEVEGTPYFVMSYADRGSIGDLTGDGERLPPARVVDLIGQAAEGLAVLHRHGVIHRDIKPQNLLIQSTPGGGERVLVADLGVAKAMLHASGLTQVVGTPAYMAPEQASGIGLDLRADVHALGAVAYRLLTGRLVRDDGIGGLADPSLPAAPSTVAPVPAAYDAPLLRALQVDPDDRWPDTLAFAAALREAQQLAGDGALVSTPTPAPSPTSTATVYESAQSADPAVPAASEPAPDRARPMRVALIALLVLAVSFGIAFGATRLLDDDADRSPNGAPTSDEASDGPAADIDFPTLTITSDQTYERHIVTNGDQEWSYVAPTGWVAYRATYNGKTIAPGRVDQQAQVRWRPEGEPLEGGYSLRVQARTSTDTVTATLEAKVEALESSPDIEDVDIYEQTNDAIYFTYLDGNNRLRYNFFRWLADADGAATFEISVSGRTADEDGLSDLLDVVAQEAEPA